MANPERVKQFGGKLLNIYTGGMLTKLIEVGYRVGLFEASKAGPGTSAELSDRADLDERYVREWLGAMTTSGIYSYEPETERYTLPEEHAALLTGDTAQNLSPMSRIFNHFGTHLEALAGCFQTGGGIPYSAYRPVFTDCMDDIWRRVYDQQLVDGFIGAVEGLTDALRRGVNVLDIGCGTGHAMNILAAEFPASSFHGYDIAEDGIERAREESAALGLSNTKFEVVDVANLPGEPEFDLITAFDAIHDQKSPADVLRGIHRSMSPGGTFLMVEFKFSSNLEDNIDNPFAPLYYSVSLMHCMPVSLAVGGDGLGTVWGEQKAREYLARAGFGTVRVLETPRPQNYMFVCNK